MAGIGEKFAGQMLAGQILTPISPKVVIGGCSLSGKLPSKGVQDKAGKDDGRFRRRVAQGRLLQVTTVHKHRIVRCCFGHEQEAPLLGATGPGGFPPGSAGLA